jgi:hypothetical protein
VTTCKECGTESPDETEPLREWLIRQEHKRWTDEFVYGSAFGCPACGARFDPTKQVVEL